MASPVVESTYAVGWWSEYPNKTSIACNKPSGTADGDLLLAFVRLFSAGDATHPSGWTDLNSSATYCSLGWKVASSEPSSWTWTFSDNASGQVSVLRVSGANTTTPLDTWQDRTTGWGKCICPSVTPSTTDTLLVIGAPPKSWDGATTPSGFTLINTDSGSRVTSLAHKAHTSGATGDKDWSLGDDAYTTDTWTFAAAAAAAGHPAASRYSAFHMSPFFGSKTIWQTLRRMRTGSGRSGRLVIPSLFPT